MAGRRTGPALARTNPQPLSTNLPMRLKDASVTDPDAVTLQHGSGTTVADYGHCSLRGGPALKFGLPGRIELSLAAFRQLRDASNVHGNLTGVELEWNLNWQTRHIPAFLVADT